jgi:hypothetical protein
MGSLDNVTTLQSTLEHVAEPDDWGFPPQPDVQLAASTCLEMIQEMPPFSLL